ncbi:hypothetical protein T492DRAFT_982399 [Pavlovales sp. CCMP2436]|nr:hypothetical protein T492DRAFT_982399 [Pavlovales sp. CCMP2436]
MLPLGRRNLTVEDGYALGFVVGNATQLRALSLAHNPSLTADGVLPIAAAIAQCPHLSELDLSDTAMLRGETMTGDGSPHRLHPQLDRLEVRCLSVLSDSLRKTKVTSLAVGGVGMGARELHLLAPAWSAVAYGDAPLRLSHLRLGHNKLGDDGAAELARSLARVGSLTVLDLQANRIGCAGAAALAALLETSPRLHVLSLRANRVSSTGAAALAQGCLLAERISWLDLGLNPVGVGGDAGLRRLSTCLATGAAPRLERLSLDGSGLAARHRQWLREAHAARDALSERFGLVPLEVVMVVLQQR